MNNFSETMTQLPNCTVIPANGIRGRCLVYKNGIRQIIVYESGVVDMIEGTSLLAQDAKMGWDAYVWLFEHNSPGLRHWVNDEVTATERGMEFRVFGSTSCWFSGSK